METLKELELHLEDYPKTRSTNMDSVFGMFESDVSGLAANYRKGEVSLYTKGDYLEELKEWFGADPELLEEELDKVPSHASYVVSEMGGNEYFVI